MGQYYITYNNDFLAHHGIIEQQWGVRRGPPYPLSRTSDGRLNSKKQAERKRESTQDSKLSRQKLGRFFNRKTPEEKEAEKIAKADNKWISRNFKKIYNGVMRKSKKEMDQFVKHDLNRRLRARNSNGQMSMTYVNEYNRKLAEVMNKNAEGIQAPSGRVVKFIPKRGTSGVHLALADPRDTMSSYKRGIYSDGRIAYKQNHIDMTETQEKSRFPWR